MKIKTRTEILKDIIKQGKKHPKNWGVLFGKDQNLQSNDYYIFNPNVGIYLLKEYQKNPYETKGVGGKIARHVDEGIEAEISKKDGEFGIIQSDIQRILKNLETGIQLEKIFKAAMNGKNLGIKMPVRGKASSSEKIFNDLKNELVSKQKKIDEKFEKIASEDDLYKSYS